MQGLSFGPTFQQDFEAAAAWVRHLRGAWRPLLLLVKQGGRLKGIVPLMRRCDRRRGILPFRRVRFLAWDRTDFSTVLAAPRDAGPVTEAALEWLLAGGTAWESLLLGDLVEGHPAAAAAKRRLAARGVAFTAAEGRYYHIDLARPFREVMRDTSRRFVRKNVNLAGNRIARAGAWDVVHAPAWDADRVVAEAGRIHVARQAALGRPSLFEEAPQRAFLREVIDHQARAGRFRSAWLRRGDRLIAYLLGFEEKGVYYAWNMAFDPGEAYFYPSRLLLHELLKDCHARGLTEFSFMRGEAEYKSKWTPCFRVNHRLTVRNPTPYGRVLSLLETTFRRAEAR